MIKKCKHCGKQNYNADLLKCEFCNRYLIKESQLLNEWLRVTHPMDLQWKRVRLGPTHNKEESKRFLVLNRWADAIVIFGAAVHIVEAKLDANLSAIGQLQGYKKLFPDTLEFSSYKDWPVEMIYLTPIFDAGIADLCAEKNIKYIIYQPKSLNPIGI